MTGIFFKLLFKAMVLMVIVLGLLSYFAYLRGMDPVAMLKAPFAASGSASVTRAVHTAPARVTPRELNTVGSTSTVYRWRDAQGNVHFGDRVPEGVGRADALEIDPDANLVMGTGPARAHTDKPMQAEIPGVAGLSDVYRPERIRQLFEQAEQLQGTLQQRYQFEPQ
jgi:hypothetical protein